MVRGESSVSESEAWILKVAPNIHPEATHRREWVGGTYQVHHRGLLGGKRWGLVYISTTHGVGDGGKDPKQGNLNEGGL